MDIQKIKLKKVHSVVDVCGAKGLLGWVMGGVDESLLFRTTCAVVGLIKDEDDDDGEPAV